MYEHVNCKRNKKTFIYSCRFRWSCRRRLGTFSRRWTEFSIQRPALIGNNLQLVIDDNT